MIPRYAIVVISLQLLLSAAALGQAVRQADDLGEPAVVVDLTRSDPVETSVNARGSSSLWLRASVPDGHTATNVAFHVAGKTFATDSLVLWVRGCGTRAPGGCDRFDIGVVGTGNDLVRVTVPARAFLVRLTADLTANGQQQRVSREVHVEVNDRWWMPTWSGGLMFSDKADRFGFQEAAGERTVVPIGDAEHGRAFVAMGNMMLRAHPSLGWTFGIGAETAELQSLIPMVGATLAFRPATILDSVFVTVGVAHVPRRQIRHEFRNGAVVPAETQLDDVLETQRRFKPFIALTFRTGGRDIRPALGGGAP